MDRESNARALRPFETSVVGADRVVECGVGVKSHFSLNIVSPFGIDVVAIARRVDLHVLRPFAHQRLDLRFEDWPVDPAQPAVSEDPEAKMFRPWRQPSDFFFSKKKPPLAGHARTMQEFRWPQE